MDVVPVLDLQQAPDPLDLVHPQQALEDPPIHVDEHIIWLDGMPGIWLPPQLAGAQHAPAPPVGEHLACSSRWLLSHCKLLSPWSPMLNCCTAVLMYVQHMC